MINTSNPNKFYVNLLKNSSWLFSGNLVNSMVGMLTMVITARFLGLAEFGFFLLAQTYVLILGLIISFQTWQPVVKFASDPVAKKDLVVASKVISVALLCDGLAAWFFGALAVSCVFSYGDTAGWTSQEKGVLFAFLLVIFVNVSGAFSGFLRVTDRYSTLAKGQVQFSLLRLVLVTLVAISDGGLVEFALAWALAEVYSHIYICVKGIRAFKDTFGGSFRLSFSRINERRELLAFMLANNIDVSIRMVSRQADIVLLGLLAGKEVVALYKVAVQICSIPLRFTDPVYQALLPQFSKAVADGQEHECRRRVVQISFAGLMLFPVIIIPYWFVGAPVIELLFGAQFGGAYEIGFVYLFALVGAMAGLPYVPYFQSLGKAKLCMWIQLFSTAIYILAMYPLIASFDAVGAAASYVVYYLAWLILALVCFARRAA